MTETGRTRLAFFFGKVLPVLCLLAILLSATWISHHQNMLAARKQIDNVEQQKITQIRIAATDDLKPALNRIILDYRAINPNTVFSVTYDSSGILCQQISNKAMFDLFLSADRGYPRELAERGFADHRAIFQYAIGKLVVWIPNAAKLDFEKHGINELIDPSVRKVAVPDPKTCPYGQVALMALKNLGVYDSVKPRIIFCPNASQAAKLAQSGSAETAIIPLSIGMTLPMREAGSTWQVPTNAYPPIQQFGVILRGAGEAASAREFLAFLSNSESTATLIDFGYSVPEARN